MKELFLGGILVAILFLLWRKEQGQPVSFGAPGPGPSPSPTPSGGCGGSCGGPSAVAAPVAQSTLTLLGLDGQISPGTPPLQTITGTGSFYNADGPTPDTTFPTVPQLNALPASETVGPVVGNVPGSPTTPANIVPVRATQPTGTFWQTGFQQRYNVVGVPRVYLQ